MIYIYFIIKRSCRRWARGHVEANIPVEILSKICHRQVLLPSSELPSLYFFIWGLRVIKLYVMTHQ